eukprot:TRINITY_DN3873_c0_g1_i1.p1 TRINITY_DN3873_c0_g1~~TRINITY_DN3873_c0_g1_i1.p1  ORF type:complete len:129 (+),score=41.93 TRINITY_DN3873_c0_g1_i1:131-517(+)
MPQPILINLRDSNNFFKSGSSVDNFDQHGKMVIIFQNPGNGVAYLFDTTWGTILKESTNLLTFPVDEHSRMFIDRLPGMFPWLLNYLSTGSTDVSQLTPEAKKQLAEDIQFYDVKNLLPLLPQLSQYK